MLTKLYQLNKWKIFVALTLATLYFSFMMNVALPFERMTFNSLSEQLSANRIQELLENQKKMAVAGLCFCSCFFSNKMAISCCSFRYWGFIFRN